VASRYDIVNQMANHLALLSIIEMTFDSNTPLMVRLVFIVFLNILCEKNVIAKRENNIRETTSLYGLEEHVACRKVTKT